MPTMSFRSSGASGTVEQRRRRVVLEVDDELAVARGFRARVGERAEEPPALGGELAQLAGCGVARRRAPTRSDASSAS